MFKLPDRLIRKLSDNQFTLAANRPNTWGLAGNRLLIAADLISPHIREAEVRNLNRIIEELDEDVTARDMTDEEQNDMFQAQTISVWAMLVAMGFENFLKGIIVSRQLHTQISENLPFASHNLLDLAKYAEVQLTKNEEKQLRMLTEYSVWRGRYNLPVNSNELYQSEKIRLKRSNSTSLGNIERAIKSLEKLKTKLIYEFEIARDYWNNGQHRNHTIPDD